MFDLGFGELLLLAVIALVVLGPERLPVAARLAGRWIRKAREQWNSVKSELENEIADEELRRQLRETAEAMRAGQQQMRSLHEDLASGTQSITQMTALKPAPAEAAAPAEPTPGPPAAPDASPRQVGLFDPDTPSAPPRADD